MIAYWGQFEDSLNVTPVSVEKGAFKATYKGSWVFYFMPKPEIVLSEDFDSGVDKATMTRFKELVRDLSAGRMVICGETYYHYVKPGDIDVALDDLAHLRSRVEVREYVDSEPRYKGYKLAGKYILLSDAIRDLLANNR
jgi:hypothetical protein